MTTLSTWQLDPAHTEVGFAVKHLMIATVKGRFADVQGTLQLDGNDPTRVQGDIRIGANSITTGNAQRDAHLRSADFFDAERFPTIRFLGRRIETGGSGRFRLIGELTIRGVTREVALEVAHEGMIQDPWGQHRAGYSAQLAIKRSDFGMTWNQLIEAGGVTVGDEVRISIEAELVQQGVEQAA